VVIKAAGQGVCGFRGGFQSGIGISPGDDLAKVDMLARGSRCGGQQDHSGWDGPAAGALRKFFGSPGKADALVRRPKKPVRVRKLRIGNLAGLGLWGPYYTDESRSERGKGRP
jgi:hypothetical protein